MKTAQKHGRCFWITTSHFATLVRVHSKKPKPEDQTYYSAGYAVICARFFFAATGLRVKRGECLKVAFAGFRVT